MTCEHTLDGEFLHPSDAEVLSISGLEESFRVDVAVPCPECDQALRLSMRAESVREADLELPLEDTEDVYD